MPKRARDSAGTLGKKHWDFDTRDWLSGEEIHRLFGACAQREPCKNQKAAREQRGVYPIGVKLKLQKIKVTITTFSFMGTILGRVRGRRVLPVRSGFWLLGFWVLGGAVVVFGEPAS